jgi:hypothetical protein
LPLQFAARTLRHAERRLSSRRNERIRLPCHVGIAIQKNAMPS